MDNTVKTSYYQNRKKEYGNNIEQFNWNRDVKKSSIKAVSYSENLLEHSSDFSKLEIEYPDLMYGFKTTMWI